MEDGIEVSYADVGSNFNGTSFKTLTRENIRPWLNTLCFDTSLETRGNTAIIRIQTNAGTSMLLSKADDDLEKLKSKSYKKERRGSYLIFHIRLESENV